MRNTPMDMNLIKDMADAVRATVNQKARTSAYDTSAEVKRVEGNTAWVHIPGGIDETPVQMTVNAEPGDKVQVRVSGGTAFLVGNGSAPPTDDKKAIAASKIAESAKALATDCAKNLVAAVRSIQILDVAVAEAREIIDATSQHFWTDDNGAHVSTVEGEAAQGKNLLMNSLGILLRNGSNVLAQFSASQAAFYDGNGNNEGNITAVFGSDGVVIGKNNGYQMAATGSALTGKNSAGVTVLSVDAAGASTDAPFDQIIGTEYSRIRESSFTTALAVYESPPLKTGSTITIVLKKILSISGTTYPKTDQLVFTQGTAENMDVGIFDNSTTKYAEVRVSYDGDSTFTLYGKNVMSSGHWAAYALMSKCTGIAYMPAPIYSFGTRYRTSNNENGGAFSAIMGEGLIASCKDQSVFGKFNEEDTNDEYAVIVGNGTDDSNRSNAYTLDWDGNLAIAGKLKSKTEALTITRTNNSYCDTTSVGRLLAIKKNGFLFLNGNLELTASMPNGTTETEICTVSGWDAYTTIVLNVAGQTGGGTLGIAIYSGGSVKVFNVSGSAATGFHRFTAVVPCHPDHE